MHVSIAYCHFIAKTLYDATTFSLKVHVLLVIMYILISLLLLLYAEDIIRKRLLVETAYLMTTKD